MITEQQWARRREHWSSSTDLWETRLRLAAFARFDCEAIVDLGRVALVG